MDGLSSTASVIAVVQLAGSLVKLCANYIQEVKDARNEIFTLQKAIVGLQETLLSLHTFLQSNNGRTLPTSSRILSNVADCLSDLQDLGGKLDPGKGKQLMRKVGFRALKWPLERAEVEGFMERFERYKSSFLLSLQVDQISLMVNVAQNTDRINQHADLDKLEGAMDAAFDSFSDRDEVQCLRGTRTELLKQIMEWAMSPSQKSIFWLKGMAGTGKSTISRTVASSLKDMNQLGASFFFKRGEKDRGNAKKFFPTLVRQLMLGISGLRSGVQKILHKDPDIGSKSLQEQFNNLLLQPLLTLSSPGKQPQTAVIVIDALDECEWDKDIRTIIQLLPSLQKVKAVRLRVFLTSRPELPISLGFSKITKHEYHEFVLHEIPEEVTANDIRLFLKDRFIKITLDRDLPQDWPGDNVIEELVTMSVPLFISAATVCRYIENAKWEAKMRLGELLAHQAKYISRMDKTYLPILMHFLGDQENDEAEQQQLLEEFHEIVGAIVLLAVPLSVNALSTFLWREADQIGNRLDSFQSVLTIPVDRDRPVRFLHLSFRDFLAQTRTIFHIDEPRKHKDIFRLCLKTMRSKLKKDICNLESPGIPRADIDPRYIRQYLPSQLQYACCYWIHHLSQSEASPSDIEDVQLFLQKHFLHWIEAMSVLGLMSEVIGLLDTVQTLKPSNENSTKADFLYDAKRFVLKNFQIADEAPLQIYSAGLIFAPRTAGIRMAFETDLPKWICQLPRVNEAWSVDLQSLEGHSDAVHSVAFSPNGRLLASSSDDGTVRLWDPKTGALQQTLEIHGGHEDMHSSVAFSADSQLLACTSGAHQSVWLYDVTAGALKQILKGHLDGVNSVAFSPNGLLLASGSDDKTIRLWNPASGALQQTLRSYSSSVYSVTFSFNSQLLASGSNDGIVRLWDPRTGALKQTLKAYWGPVYSVTFSFDSRLLASGSEDGTVRLWDPTTGSLLQILRGHKGPVASVAFSPNDRLLASGSDDETIRLWNPASGALQKTLKGPGNPIRSVAFSPGGGLLASGSLDRRVWLWDMVTDCLQQTHYGHSDSVFTVAFSPDGQQLASGSADMTVRLWNPETGDLKQTLKGHSGPVRSVAFSPDGQQLASGSTDMTIRIWNPVTGDLQQTLKGHSGPLWSVAFSPDSRLLASVSRDCSVRLWNPVTGALQQTLKGHNDSVYKVAFSLDSQLLASGSQDMTIRLWNIANGSMQQTLRGHLGWVNSVAFSLDGRLLASGFTDGTVEIWDIATGGLQQTLYTKELVTDIEFSQDGSYLITNFGILNIQPRNGQHTFHGDLKTRKIFIEQRRWINIHGKNMLWLPPDFRPVCSAINGDLLALGHASGRVSFLRFCL